MSKVEMMVPVTEAEVSERVLVARRNGETEAAIGRRFGLSSREVRRLLMERVADFKAEDRALEAYLDIHDLTELQHKLRAWFRETDDPRIGCDVATVWNKLAETKANILGTNAPRRQEGSLTLVEAVKPSSTEKIRAILDRVINEKPAEVHRPTTPDGEQS